MISLDPFGYLPLAEVDLGLLSPDTVVAVLLLTISALDEEEKNLEDGAILLADDGLDQLDASSLEADPHRMEILGLEGVLDLGDGDGGRAVDLQEGELLGSAEDLKEERGITVGF